LRPPFGICSSFPPNRPAGNAVRRINVGFSRSGIDPQAVIRKFNSITAGRLGQASRERIIDAVMALDQSPSCAQLIEALAGASKA